MKNLCITLVIIQFHLQYTKSLIINVLLWLTVYFITLYNKIYLLFHIV
jgi:hypothetical protein